MNEMKQLAKTYEPGEVEERIYHFWLEGDYFHAEVNPDKKRFTWGTRWTKPFRIS